MNKRLQADLRIPLGLLQAYAAWYKSSLCEDYIHEAILDGNRTIAILDQINELTFEAIDNLKSDLDVTSNKPEDRLLMDDCAEEE